MNWKELFPTFENELISILEKEAVFRKFSAGDIIIRTGQPIRSTVLILQGRINIYRQNEEGGEFLMYYLGPGQACAISMICAVQSETSEVMAKAEEDTEILMLPATLMDKLANKYRSWYRFVIQTYRGRFDELLQVIDNIAFRNMDERLEFYLQRRARTSGSKKIELSHQQIADDLHSSREVISRLLKKMEQRNYLHLHRNMIELL